MHAPGHTTRTNRASGHLEVELEAVTDGALGGAEPDWTTLESEAQVSPYATFGWLESWVAVYRPRRLRLIRVEDPERGLVALGLLEELPFRRLRFAGVPVTPIRGLVCRDGEEARAWKAVTEWLRRRRDWAWIDACGVSREICGLDHAVLMPEPWFSLALPESFDQYLTERPGLRRREMRRRMRIAEREGATTHAVEGANTRGALDAFVALHSARAQRKGEMHSAIDDRLAMMLERVAQRSVPELRVFVLRRDGQTLAVAVNVDHGGVSWAYNTGFAPAAAGLSPGHIVRLASIRDAIERGAGRFDFGPGDFIFKRELGCDPTERLKVGLGGGSPVAQGWRAVSLSRRYLRRVTAVRTAVDKLRGLRARASYARSSTR
jgi:CelD/BcsL family acetyltransferase involved in cellulose biosynthesis